jgi:hypothetical protein
MNPNSTKLRANIEAARQRSQNRKAGKIKKKPIPERQVKAIEMGYAYETVLGYYRHCPTLQYFKMGEDRGFRNSTITFLFKAAVMADKSKAGYRQWVEAQFYWFHKWFKRPPKVHELSGQSGKFPAPRRYKDFVKLQQHGKAQVPSSDVLPRERASKDSIDKINEERLQQLCSAWGRSEKEIIEQFALSGIFDMAWLKRNVIFKRLNFKTMKVGK